MTLATLALMMSDAHACTWVEVEVDTDHRCGDDDRDEAPQAAFVQSDDGRDDEILLQYGLQFLPRVPAHQLRARMSAESDAYLGAEVRYMPAQDIRWAGRIGAGIDVFGGGNWDLTLGLWIGSAGEWDHDAEDPAMYLGPIAGTEIGLGFSAEHIFAKYRWLGGFGGGPIDELLSENELTVGYKITDEIHALGQYLILAPGDHDNEHGLGLGVRVVL